MKDIYWKKLSTWEKVVFVLGWFHVFSLVYWATFIVTYIVGRDRKGIEFKEFFNPHTFKVPYIFGWIVLIVMLVVNGFMILFGMVF